MSIFPDPHVLMIGLSSITYGIFSISIYLFFHGLNVKFDWLMTLFVLFQVSTLRTTWDLQKDILALSFTFFIFYLILKDRKASITAAVSSSYSSFWSLSLLSSFYHNNQKVIYFCLIISLVILTLLTDIMISFLLIISLSIYFILSKDKKYIVSLGMIIIIVISFLVLIVDSSNSQVSSNIKTMLNGAILEDAAYSQLNLAILFIMTNGLLLPFLFYGVIHLRELLLYIPLSLSLIGSFTWLVLPYSSILLPDRWITISGIFISIFASYGLVRLSSLSSLTSTKVDYQKKSNYKILLPIFSIFIIIGLFYMVLPTTHAFPIYGVFSSFTQKFVPTTMQFNSIDIVDNEDLLMTIDWLNNNTDSNSIIYGSSYFKGWMNILLKEERIFEYHNMDFSNNGIYIVLEMEEEVVVDEIDSINSPVKLLFSQGVFKIIEK